MQRKWQWQHYQCSINKSILKVIWQTITVMILKHKNAITIILLFYVIATIIKIKRSGPSRACLIQVTLVFSAWLNEVIQTLHGSNSLRKTFVMALTLDPCDPFCPVQTGYIIVIRQSPYRSCDEVKGEHYTSSVLEWEVYPCSLSNDLCN